MLREWQTVNQAGLSPHEMHCHQYRGMEALPGERGVQSRNLVILPAYQASGSYAPQDQ